jgi:hypothetical protein
VLNETHNNWTWFSHFHLMFIYIIFHVNKFFSGWQPWQFIKIRGPWWWGQRRSLKHLILMNWHGCQPEKNLLTSVAVKASHHTYISCISNNVIQNTSASLNKDNSFSNRHAFLSYITVYMITNILAMIEARDSGNKFWQKCNIRGKFFSLSILPTVLFCAASVYYHVKNQQIWTV